LGVEVGRRATSVSFHIPEQGTINQRVRAWVDSFGKTGGRQRSAAIREAIYQYHLAEREEPPAELVQLLNQQTALLMRLARQVEQLQAELAGLRQTGVVAAPVEAEEAASTANEQKLKQLTDKFF